MIVEFQYVPTKRKVKIVSEYFGNIREHFSVKNPAARFVRFGGFVPQRLYAITPAGYCGVGLVPEIVKYLGSLNIPFEYKYNKEYLDVFNKLHLKFDGNVKELDCELKIRPYQKEAVIEALRQCRGNLVVGTSGGKTLIMATIINNIDAQLGKTLIIVPDLGLVEQTYKDFISYGLPSHIITKWTGKQEPDLSSNITIANLGILQSKNTDLHWLDQVAILIFDECLRKNTIIDTINGPKYIQNITTNDYVLSRNMQEGKNEYCKVHKLWKNLYKSCSYNYFLEIKTTDNNLIHVTPNHKFFTQRGIINAEQLTTDDELITIKSPYFMYLWYKYMYAKNYICKYLQNLW